MKINVRILLIRYSRMICRQMIYAPADAAAFPKVPIRKSMSLMQFCSSAHPKPFLPRAPKAWASST